ncbi:hypothetical protein ETB97_005288 [Aspergillus alliaceus]|uniref:non-reducing end alpha-L-arabinofuranosidase n=1 Tax=Petromyces alliaceus TaxID=209559 RepID=A0A8H5ZYW2_PETAA|nr:hypothetical protein ETB97_005288 [Aspergillus burnettii]
MMVAISSASRIHRSSRSTANIMSFASTATESGYSLIYLSFTNFNKANSAIFHYLDQAPMGSGYRAAPQVSFKPHNLWYLAYQNGNAAY